MAIEFFNTESNATNPQLFFNEWIKEQPKSVDGKTFAVNEIKAVKSGKGYMVQTDSFNCWLWANSSVTKHLIEAIDVWLNKGVGYELVVQVNKKAKDGYLLGVNKELQLTWFKAGGKYSTSEDILTTDGETGNPFL